MLVCIVRRNKSGENELLLVRSCSSSFFHFPSGTVNPTETIADAAQRELREEACIAPVLRPTSLTYRFNYPNVLFHPRSTQEIYIGTVTLGIHAEAAHEIEELRWCPITEAKGLVYPDLSDVIDSVFDITKLPPFTPLASSLE